MQYTNNRYEWWMGMRRTTFYGRFEFGDGQLDSIEYVSHYIPNRGLWQGIIRPGF